MVIPPAGNAKTFVSYARQDAEFVLTLAANLRQAGVNLWLAPTDIPPGARWDVAVEEALAECPRLLVILSPDSVLSHSVLDEVHYALDEGKAVIPALYRECKVPFRLRRLQRVDVGSNIANLLTALGGKPDTPPPPPIKPEPTSEAERLLAELPSETITHLRRRDIGQRLAQIGDPRKGVGLLEGLPDILWRPIPAGEVEIEDHGRFPVQPFHMAAFPLTFIQFRAFLEASDGFDDERWWSGLNRQPRDNAWKNPLANYPVTDVSWHDAMAFSRWLSAWRRYETRLPDEREWQWAAQSAQAKAYPWGPDWRDGVANTEESGINGTTAVGMYPAGNSRQAVSDLSGNVWEWCLNEYKKPERIQPGGEESRVLRGGSWLIPLDNARAVSRFHLHPDGRYFLIGFRVVCWSPIAGH